MSLGPLLTMADLDAAIAGDEERLADYCLIPALESPDRRPALSPPAARSASIRQELPRSVLHQGRGW
jgi:hypothetical protein